MAKKSYLDSIEVPKPCDAAWYKMIGNDAKRFCLSCEKDVYNLSAMSRREARKLVANNAGKICVRYARLPNGKLFTTDTNLYQITRRTSTIAAGVIATTLSFSAITYAQGAPIVRKSEAKQKEVVEQGKDKKTKNEIGTSQISFTVYDQMGIIIPEAKVKLTNQETKKEYVALANDKGLAKFQIIPKAFYEVEISSLGFADYKLNIYVKENVEPNIRITLNVGFIGTIITVEYEIPLFQAIVQKDDKIIKRLINLGFDVNTQDSNGETALHVAVEHGNLEIVKFLLKKDANINAKTKYNRTPIWMIDDEKMSVEILKLLISKGVDVNAPNEDSESNEETLLMIASANNDINAVKLLLQLGANPNLKDKEEETALMKTDNQEIIEILRRYGAIK